MKKFLSPIFQTVSGKVGLLSTVLLGLVFIIIVYSIVRISDIRIEMREIAEIDIPLTEAVSEIEVLQLELHLLMEKIQLAQYKDSMKVVLPAHLLLAKYTQVNLNLQHHLSIANTVLDNALEQKLIIDDLSQHQKMQKDLHLLQKTQAEFSRFVVKLLTDIETNALTNQQWTSLEKDFQKLDSTTANLLKQMIVLLEDVVQKTKLHTEHFYWVIICLGLSAFIIGIYITIYTVWFIHKRFSAIHNQLNKARYSIQNSVSTLAESGIEQNEFELLSNHIQNVVDAYSDELSLRSQVEKGLLQLAMTDKLTGAYNRHKWNEVIGLELSMFNRGSHFSIIYIDLDHFKKINDQFGHNIGDTVLKQSVALMKQTVRDSDAVFRMGGEEFVILLRGTKSEAATVIAEKVKVIFSSFEQTGLPAFTASFGVTECQKNDTLTSLFERVDAALYEAKHSGRNNVVTA